MRCRGQRWMKRQRFEASPAVLPLLGPVSRQTSEPQRGDHDDPAHAVARDAIGITGAVAAEGLSAFMRVRPRLFGIAYRMLGSAVEAEDIVQDVWVRWQTADRSLVRDAAAFLATTATRLAINVMQSARSRRETYAWALAAGTSRYQRRPSVGSGTRPGVGVWGSVAAGKADSHRTSRLHPSGGVRLSIPRHRECPSA